MVHLHQELVGMMKCTFILTYLVRMSMCALTHTHSHIHTHTHTHTHTQTHSESSLSLNYSSPYGYQFCLLLLYLPVSLLPCSFLSLSLSLSLSFCLSPSLPLFTDIRWQIFVLQCFGQKQNSRASKGLYFRSRRESKSESERDLRARERESQREWEREREWSIRGILKAKDVVTVQRVRWDDNGEDERRWIL